MNYDELAFFNQQLAMMLRDGIPLEGAVKQLCVGMKSGPLRTEMAELESDLSRGTPLKDAITRRALPEFYTRMVALGARTNDLPGVLTLVADYYQRTNSIWNRLKGLMVYPFLVLLASLGLSFVLGMLAKKLTDFILADWYAARPGYIFFSLWLAPFIIAIVLLAGLAIVKIPQLRARARWRFPAFREASLAELASAIALMLKSGTPLPEALAMASAMESGSPAAHALNNWRAAIESGQAKSTPPPESLAPLPPLFLWLVQQGGEDLAAGFQKAAEVYQSRASYKIELLLYGILPISVLFLGQMIIWQVAPVFQMLAAIMNSVGGNN
jgi:type II secretory pathway component PulF